MVHTGTTRISTVFKLKAAEHAVLKAIELAEHMVAAATTVAVEQLQDEQEPEDVWLVACPAAEARPPSWSAIGPGHPFLGAAQPLPDVTLREFRCAFHSPTLEH